MKISVLMFLIIFFISSCNKITVRFNSPKGLISSQLYTAETAPDGSGLELNNVTVEVGDNLMLYALKRNPSTNSVTNLPVSWSKSGASGNLIIVGSGESSEFIPLTPGTVQVAMSVSGVQVKVVNITIIPAAGPSLNVSNLMISGITPSAFTATLNFTGGSPSQVHTLYYCNATATPGCNPVSGSSQVMSVSGATYTTTITGLTNPGNVFNIRAISSDSVTVTGSPLNTTATLAYTNLSVSGLTASAITYSGLTATINFTGGTPGQSHTLYYCNATATPGCDPGVGLFTLMIKSGSAYYATLTGLTAPTNDFNLRVVSTDSVTITGSPQNISATLLGSPITVSAMSATNKTKTGMTITTTFTGDSENNSSATLSYCNNTDTPGCNPTTGITAAMTRSGSTYTYALSGLSSPYDEADNLNFRIVVTDPNGVTGSPLNSSFRLADFYLSTLSTPSIDTNSFSSTVNFTDDSNATGTVRLYYCNETDSPGCNPTAGSFVTMTRGAGVYTASVTGLTSPNDPSDQLNIRAIAYDATDGAYNNNATLIQTIRLVDLELGTLSITEISDTKFFASLLVNNLDNNANATAVLYFCDATLAPACNPLTGSSTSMTFSQWPDRYSKFYTTNTIPKGHLVNVEVVINDPDTIYQGGQVASTISMTTSFKIPDPKDIYRSVGPGQTSALHNGVTSSNTLSITGSSATFSSALQNQVGVGDAIFYDSNGDNGIDAVAFIHGRINNQTYTVKDVDGNTPTAAAAHQKWKLYRAYVNASNAENGVENSGITADNEIPAALRNFDSWSGGKDISAQTGADQNWNFALYAGVQADDIKVYLQSAAWKKDKSQVIKFYTPNRPDEVGVSQRHNGVWDNSKYRLVVNNSTAIEVNPTRTIIEGLQIEITGTANNVYGINSFNNSEGRIIGNLIKSSSTGTGLYGVFFYNYGMFADRQLWFYNNIIYNFNTTSSRGFHVDWSDSDGNGAQIYNNIFYNNYTAIRLNTWAAACLNNNIILGSISEDFLSGGTASQELRNNIVGDGTYNTIPVWGANTRVGNITGLTANDVFMDALNEDFRMAPASPAIGAGIDNSAIFSTDITGATRTNPFDIGAFKN